MATVNLDIVLKVAAGIRGNASKVYFKVVITGRAESKRLSREVHVTPDVSRTTEAIDELFHFQNIQPQDEIKITVKAKHFFKKETVNTARMTVAEALDVARVENATKQLVFEEPGSVRGTVTLAFKKLGHEVDGLAVSDMAQKNLESPEAALNAQTDNALALTGAASAGADSILGRMSASYYRYLAADWRYALPAPSPTQPLPCRGENLDIIQIGFVHKPNMFLAGQNMEMCIEMIVGSPLIVFRSLYVTFHGKAKGKLANLKMLSTVTKEELILARCNLLGKMQKEQNRDRLHLEPGKHIFPISVALPSSLPTSAFLREGSIKYQVIVEADIVNGNDLVKKQEITIVNPNDLSSFAPRTSLITKTNSKSPMGAGGPIEMTATLVKAAASMDEEFEMDLIIKNLSASKTVKKIAVQLRRTVYTNSIPDDINGDTVHEWKQRIQPRLIPGEIFRGRIALEMDEIEDVARFACSLRRAKYECVYKLRVKVVLANSTDLYVDLPVRVCAPDPSRPLAVRRRLPSLQQIATCLPTHPADWSARMVQAWAEKNNFGHLQQGLLQFNVTGFDLMGLKDEAYVAIANASGHPNESSIFKASIEGLISAFIASRKMLEELSLRTYLPIFDRHQVLESDLPMLTEKDLWKMDVPAGPRKRIMAYLNNKYRNNQQAAQDRTDYTGHYEQHDAHNAGDNTGHYAEQQQQEYSYDHHASTH